MCQCIESGQYIDVCQYEIGEEPDVPTTKIATVTDVCCPSVLEAPLSEDQAGQLARMFAALADPVRLRLLSLVAAVDEVCSCDLQAPLGKSQPTVSHHTKALADAGLIAGERRGKWVWWRVVPERLAALRAALAPTPPD
jgi:ArsR family transcriptional regulator, arsenate/arsenite/antimonite-responsive transcriptional repressor